MKLKVKVSGHLNDLFGKKEFEVELPNDSTLDDLITRIGEIYGKEKEAELRPKESAKFPIMISVGNKDHRFFGGMKTPLQEGITVYFMPPAVGG